MSFLRRVFIDQVINFCKESGISDKGYFNDKAKIIDRGCLCIEVKEHVLSFNMILIFSRSVFLDRVIRLGGNLGDEEKCRSPKKLKSLIEVPYVAHLKVQVLSFYMNLIFSL